MDEEAPPPYTPFADPTAEKPIITLTEHTDLNDSHTTAILSSLPPPPPPRPAAATEKTRPVSWSSHSHDSFTQPAGVPYFPPPANTDDDTKPAATMSATLSAPHAEPYFAPPPTLSADSKTPAQPYMPPSPKPRASSFAAPSPSVGTSNADVQFAPPPNQQWLPSQHRTSLPTPPSQYQNQGQSSTDYKISQPTAGTVPQFQQPYYSPPPPKQPVAPVTATVPQFQQPYNGPAPQQQHAAATTATVPQFQQPYYNPAAQQPSQQDPSSLNVRPALPPRPTSAPSVPQMGPQGPVTSPTQQMGDPLTHAATEGSQPTAGFGPMAYNGNFDVKTSSYGKRFVSNMLVSRVTRATWQSTVSMAGLPFHLSPWGDNNPVTLPNVRKRDVALAGLAYVGADALAPSALDASEEVIKWAGKFVAEQAADDGIEKLSKQKAQAVTARAGVASTQVRIHHKMIGEAANISLWAPRPAADFTSCAKGWFCPYLYASGRAPKLERNKDFALTQFWGPGLAADASVGPALLRAVRQANETPLAALCPAETPTHARPHYGRAAVFFLGISPFRTATAWSQARVPNQARLQFHLLAGVPVLVLPVRPSTPIVAWGAHTLRELWGGAVDVAAHVAELMGFLDAYVDPAGVDGSYGGDWRSPAAGALHGMFDQAMFLRGGVHILDKVVDPDRAGVVVFRF